MRGRRKGKEEALCYKVEKKKKRRGKEREEKTQTEKIGNETKDTKMKVLNTKGEEEKRKVEKKAI